MTTTRIKINAGLKMLAMVIACLTFGIMNTGIANASTDYNNLISDAVFDNSSTMTASQINTFLNSFSGSCISSDNGFTAPDPTGYNPTDGFIFGASTTAGQVIYDAAQAYDMNPQVLLATMQKEQSIVTGAGGCSTLAYAGTMGYGCPDGGTTYNYSGVDLYSLNGHEVTSVTGTCVSAKVQTGFSQQVIQAAWLLKFDRMRSEGNVTWSIIKGNWDNSDDPSTCYSGYMTEGTFQRCPSGSSTYYDGYATIDSTSVHMDNGATAALYDYTPHKAGNNNFVTIFTEWFGSTQPTIAYAWSPVSITYYADAGLTEPMTRSNIYLNPGGKAYVEVQATNTGYDTWTSSDVKIGTADPHDSASALVSPDWLTIHRPTNLEQATVLPGQTGTFVFDVTAPNEAGGPWDSVFNIVAENKAWLTGPNITVPVQASVAVSDPPQATLTAGQSLYVGDDILSPDTHAALVFQSNGDVALSSDFQSVWSTNTADMNAYRLIMQDDGNLVLYNASGKALWATGTNPNPGDYAEVQTSGNLVVLSSTGTTLWQSNTARLPNGLNYTIPVIGNGVILYPGQSLNTPTRTYRLTMQYDGNLVLYNASGKALWATGTNHKNAAYAEFQTDGNLVVYNASHVAVWASHTNGKAGTHLYMQYDGNLVIYKANGKAVWATGTNK